MNFESAANSRNLLEVQKDKPWVESVLIELVDKLFSADSMDQICQAFVTTDGYDTKAIGAVFCGLDTKAEIKIEGSFGKEVERLKSLASELHDKHLLYTISEATIYMPDDEDFFTVCVPATLRGMPLGFLFLAATSVGDSKFELIPSLNSMVSKSLGLLVRKIRGRDEFESTYGKTRTDIASLSPRQLDVLSHISDGLTNEQIAKTLIVSPSTVRHETIKIYDFLGVPSRNLAVEAARSRGLI